MDKLSNEDKWLVRAIHKTKEFINSNPDILFTRADKGNTTVAIDLLDYNNKMIEMLSDSNIYTVVKKDPTKILTNNVRDLLSKWLKNKYIDRLTYKKILVTDGLLPRAYGFPKLHKVGYPLRIIVSSIKSPLYALI